MSENVRVRFAPSPTGPLHIGGVRTALFNYLFARKYGGDFILRIEDTDQNRFVADSEEYINESLEWLGLNPDEGIKQGGNFGPYRQSERKDIYKKYVDQLIESGWAYYAFDTPEELEALRNECEAEKRKFSYDVNSRKTLSNSLALSSKDFEQKLGSGTPYVIRFKMPENADVKENDLIRGEVKFNTSSLDDKVIFKSDGLPTYHLANVVDDYLMNISHVIRGEEWLPSMPLHIMLYKALGWEHEKPRFAHLPLILKPSGKGKLSKRDGEKDGFPVFPINWTAQNGEISAGFREAGYFPDAVINLLALLGWNPGTEQEIFSLNELEKVFSLERVNLAGARFDPDKAKWFNQKYLQKKTNAELAELYSIVLAEKEIIADLPFIEKVVEMVKERSVFISDFWEQSSYFFMAPAEYDPKAKKKFWKDQTRDIVNDCLEILKETEPFSSENTEEKVKEYIVKNELGFGKVMNPLRLAIVGAGKGPHLFDILEIIGEEESVSRIEKALQEL